MNLCGGIKKVGDRFHEGLHSNCPTYLIDKDTICDRRTNHHDFFARKDTTLIFQNLHTNNQHPISDVDSVAKGSLNMIIFTPSSQLLRENLLILPCVCLGHLFVNFPYLIIRVLSSSFILVSKKNVCK